jgi:hypothetical protein
LILLEALGYFLSPYFLVLSFLRLSRDDLSFSGTHL